MNNSFKVSCLFLFYLFVILVLPLESVGQADNGSSIRITKIKIKGNKALETDELKKNIETQSPSIKPWVKKPVFDEEIFKDDIKRIKDLFADYGYYDTEVNYELNYNEEGNEVKIDIQINQGEPVILRDLSIKISDPSSDESEKDYLELIEEISKKIPLEIGKIFSAINFEKSKKDINDILSNDGYPKFKLESEALVNREEKWAEVNFKIKPGLKYTFGAIEIIGNQIIPNYLIRREVIFNSDDIYSLEKVNESQTRIFQLGYFRSVIIDQIYDDDELKVDTVVKVAERKLGSVRFGVGFGTEDKVRGQIGWTQRNFFGGGRNLNILAKASFITQLIQASISQPYVAGRDSELIGLLNLQRDDLPSYEGTSVTSSLGLNKRLARRLRADGAFNVIYSRISSQATRTPIEASQENVFLTTFSGGLNFNTTDNLFDPTKGIYVDERVEAAFKAFGSQVNYLSSLIDIRGYKSVSKFVFAKRFLLGMIYPFGSTGEFDVPIFKRFFAGGSNSMRGFPFQKLGPLNENEDPLGGNSLILGNLEMRFPLYKELGGVVFLDYGNVYSDSFDYSLDQLRYAIGTGFRYNTIIGPLRLDFGYALNPNPVLNRFQVFLSVGQAF
ncbi:MAG: outer membrane protein assembly factor BamA [Thermodesulfobacteriota bacterium]